MLRNSIQESDSRFPDNMQSIGPYLNYQSTGQYQKRLASFASIASDQLEALEVNQNNQSNSQQHKKQIIKMKESKAIFQTKNTNSPITTKKLKGSIQQQISHSVYSAQIQMKKIVGILFRNRYIRKFSQNLFLKSYVLPINKKKQILEDCYLQSNSSENQSFREIQRVSYYLFYPGSNYIIFFDTYILIVYLLSLWLSPFLTSFTPDYDGVTWTAIFIILGLFLDMLISINRAIIIQGEIIEDRQRIIKQYVIKQLFFDLLIIIIWLQQYLQFYKISVLSEILCVLSSIITIRKLAKNYLRYFEYLYIKRNVNSILDLITLIFTIYYYVHFMACIWHYIGSLNVQLQNTWLVQYNIIEQSIWHRYNYSFYWATVTMATIGYGDITPQNHLEITFCSIMILISSCISAYLINSIGILVKQMNDTRFKQRKQMAIISTYMRKNNLQPQIQARVKNFLQLDVQIDQNENSKKLEQLIQSFPVNLKSDILKNVQSTLINKIILLKQNFSTKFLQRISSNLIRFQAAPGDYIFKQNDQKEKNLFLMNEGKVELLEEKTKRSLQILQKDDCFGQYQFLTGFPPKFSAISRNYSEIYKISRDKFLEQLSKFHKDFERFHQIKDEILLDNNFSKISLQCHLCGQYNHQIIECGMLQYKPDLEQMLKKTNYISKQFRQKSSRRLLKQNSLEAQSIVADSIEKYKLHMTEQLVEQNGEIQKMETICEKDATLTYLVRQESQENLMQKSSKNIIISQKQLLDNNQQVTKSLKKLPLHQQIKTTQQIEGTSFNDLKYPQKYKTDENFIQLFYQPLLFHQNNIDQIKNYRYYFQEQNSTEIIKRYNKLQYDKQKGEDESNEIQKYYHKYTFNQSIVNLIIKTKKKQDYE